MKLCKLFRAFKNLNLRIKRTGNQLKTTYNQIQNSYSEHLTEYNVSSHERLRES